MLANILSLFIRRQLSKISWILFVTQATIKTPPKRNWLYLLDKEKLFYSRRFLGYRYLLDGPSETKVDNNSDLQLVGLRVILGRI